MSGFIKKVLNKYEEMNDSDVSTDIDSGNEITDIPDEPCDAVNNITSKKGGWG